MGGNTDDQRGDLLALKVLQLVIVSDQETMRQKMEEIFSYGPAALTAIKDAMAEGALYQIALQPILILAEQRFGEGAPAQAQAPEPLQPEIKINAEPLQAAAHTPVAGTAAPPSARKTFMADLSKMGITESPLPRIKEDLVAGAAQTPAPVEDPVPQQTIEEQLAELTDMLSGSPGQGKAEIPAHREQAAPEPPIAQANAVPAPAPKPEPVTQPAPIPQAQETLLPIKQAPTQAEVKPVEVQPVEVQPAAFPVLPKPAQATPDAAPAPQEPEAPRTVEAPKPAPVAPLPIPEAAAPKPAPVLPSQPPQPEKKKPNITPEEATELDAFLKKIGADGKEHAPTKLPSNHDKELPKPLPPGAVPRAVQPLPITEPIGGKPQPVVAAATQVATSGQIGGSMKAEIDALCSQFFSKTMPQERQSVSVRLIAIAEAGDDNVKAAIANSLMEKIGALTPATIGADLSKSDAYARAIKTLGRIKYGTEEIVTKLAGIQNSFFTLSSGSSKNVLAIVNVSEACEAVLPALRNEALKRKTQEAAQGIQKGSQQPLAH